MMKLPRSFYTRSALVVAPELLGKQFVRTFGDLSLRGMITEVEAYMGAEDPASHAYRGQTMRNALMFGNGGHLYVYFTYGMHYCANAVTGGPGIAQAVLFRAVAPLEGIETMLEHRTASLVKNDPGSAKKLAAIEKHLTDGPAKFCQAFAIDRRDHGTDLCGNEIYILDAPPIPRRLVHRSARIGISAGKEHEWRFFLDPATVEKYRAGRKYIVVR
ncbi:MAG TPA: DNA-3-methyladenine glycosylase [Bacteroidota bacterium]|nr:DNA-3-methyladenine glycosylase [Bacteroidota bacterium]